MGKQRVKELPGGRLRFPDSEPTTVLQKAQLALQELRDLIRVGHALVKDLRDEQKKARQVLPMLIQKRIAVAVSSELERLKNDIDEATKKKAAQISQQLDETISVLTESKNGEMTVQELAETLGPLVPLIYQLTTGEIKLNDIVALPKGTVRDLDAQGILTALNTVGIGNAAIYRADKEPPT